MLQLSPGFYALMNCLIYAVVTFKFCEDKYVEFFKAKSKTDIYRNGNIVMLVKTGRITFT